MTEWTAVASPAMLHWAGPKKPLFCVLRDELVRVKDELLTEEGRVVIYSLYWQKAKKLYTKPKVAYAWPIRSHSLYRITLFLLAISISVIHHHFDFRLQSCFSRARGVNFISGQFCRRCLLAISMKRNIRLSKSNVCNNDKVKQPRIDTFVSTRSVSWHDFRPVSDRGPAFLKSNDTYRNFAYSAL